MWFICSGDYEATPNVSTYITLQDLVNSKDISTPIRNECTNEELNYDTIKITITLDCKTKNFSYKIEDTTNKHFIRRNGVTSNDGKIIEGKYCSDLYWYSFYHSYLKSYSLFLMTLGIKKKFWTNFVSKLFVYLIFNVKKSHKIYKNSKKYE